ncbi:MAG: ABC transporter permease [Anaerolineae bacterium]|uniref:ABC transporter permease n=1 Tax=Candidatus Flexifilum breve TaxID=3140694 RepID=UPI001AD0B0E7|nr:ABC transporter permease [Chloroflexota bacterium]MBN8635812.1 ABC transporter permease [Anaerolineae bacterium]
MAQYILRRTLQALPLLFILSFILFAFTNALGDPLAVFAESRQRPTAAQREEIRRRMGLDRPMFEQYVTWLIGNDWQMIDVNGDGTNMQPGTRQGVLRGDLGNSFVTRKPAWTRIEERLPATLTLMIPSYGITLILALAIGVYSATRQYTFVDNVITGVSFFFYSMPIFFIALMTIYIFGVQFTRWDLPALPIGGTGDGSTVDLIVHMLMPVFCLVAIQLAGYVRFIRSSMLEVLGQDYIRTAHAKGMADSYVVRRHALKNASLPLITLIGLDLPFLLAGAVVTERIFAWPGMGRLFIESFERADVPVMMAILMLLCVLVVVFQILTDVVYTWFDPRIRY